MVRGSVVVRFLEALIWTGGGEVQYLRRRSDTHGFAADTNVGFSSAERSMLGWQIVGPIQQFCP